MIRRTLAITVGTLLSLGAVAPKVSAQFTLEKTQIQRTILGPAWTSDKLTGKTVLIVLWGVNVPPSHKPLARAAKIEQELGPYGLVVIGPNLQKVDDAIVEAKAKQLGVRFSVTDNIGIQGLNQVNLPMSIIFGPDGKSQFEGASDKAEVRLRTVLGAAIVDRATTKTFSKAVQPSVDQLKKGASPATVLTSLNSRKSDPDAKALIDAICLPAKELLEDAKERLESDPVGVYNDAQRLSNVFRGTAVGTQANDLFTKLKNDKSVQAELKALPSLEKVQKIDEALEKIIKMDTTKNDPSTPEFQRTHQAQIGQIRTIAVQMRSSWPKAKATSEASDIAMKYGVMFK